MNPNRCPETAKLGLLALEQADPETLEQLVVHIDHCPICLAHLAEINNQFHAALGRSSISPASVEGSPSANPALPERFKQTPGINRHNCIGHFEIVRKLGEGGMGQVYECLDLKLNRRVAVKWIKASILSPAFLELLEQEACIHARLNHPNIVSLLEYGIAEGMPYLVMELVEGGTLRTLLKEQKLGIMESAGFLMEIAKCIQDAHDQGVLHRDLKPANILLQPRPVLTAEKRGADHYPSRWIPKVTDFGLGASIDALLTETDLRDVQGTPFYMAPEQLYSSSKNIGPASDIYALGVILYELLAGRVPFEGQDLLQLKEMVLHQKPIAPRSIQAGVPIDLETICLKCLEKDPRLRYATAAKLANDLERFLQKRPILARPVGPSGKTWRWARRNPTTAFFASLSMISLTLLVAGSILFAFNQNRLREKSEELRLIAQVNESLANKRFEQIRDKFFRELEISSSGFDELRTIVDQGVAPDKVKSHYDKVIEQRFERAIEMTQRPDLLQVESEYMVEAFYLAGLRQQITDQNLAMPLFETAVNRAKAIQAKRQLNPLGRFCAMNSDNYLGVFQSQRQNPTEALKFYQDGWDHFRLRVSEPLEDPRLKKFSLIIGSNLAEVLNDSNQPDQAAIILKECEKIEGSKKPK